MIAKLTPKQMINELADHIISKHDSFFKDAEEMKHQLEEDLMLRQITNQEFQMEKKKIDAKVKNAQDKIDVEVKDYIKKLINHNTSKGFDFNTKSGQFKLFTGLDIKKSNQLGKIFIK